MAIPMHFSTRTKAKMGHGLISMVHASVSALSVTRNASISRISPLQVISSSTSLLRKTWNAATAVSFPDLITPYSNLTVVSYTCTANR